jgi:hypothetical protein
MGPAPRGGVYTYDWIENLLGLHAQRRPDPAEFERPSVGDTIGYGANVMRVERGGAPRHAADGAQDAPRESDESARVLSSNPV